MASYSKALELNKDNTDALVARGAAHANQGEYAQAVKDFRAALTLDPANANASRYLSVTLEHMQQQEEHQRRQEQQMRPPQAQPRDKHPPTGWWWLSRRSNASSSRY
jgi:Flp pilus assembly protein TadD